MLKDFRKVIDEFCVRQLVVRLPSGPLSDYT